MDFFLATPLTDGLVEHLVGAKLCAHLVQFNGAAGPGSHFGELSPYSFV